MKKMILMMVMAMLAACSQEQDMPKQMPEHSDMSMHAKEQQSVVEPMHPTQDKVQQTVADHTTMIDKHAAVEAKPSEPVKVAEKPMKEPVKKAVVSEPKATATAAKQDEVVKPVQHAPKAKQVSKDVVKSTPKVVQTAPVQDKKVVAPLVQGKQPIKSVPNPAPSEIMLKPESTMDTAKANALTKKCKSCHATDKDKVGPSWKKIQAAYGSVDTLAAVFASGFNVEDRKVAATDAKFKKKAKVMTGQYKNLIKKQVEKGKFAYNEMAQAVFAK